MKKLHRYIASTVLLSILGVIGVVAAINFVFAFVAEIGKVGEGSYSIWQAILYILMTLPSNIALVLPVTGLVGSLIGLGLLANHSELVAMRAAGISVKQIAKGVCFGALALSLLSWALNAYIAPTLQHAADMHKRMAISNQAVLVTASATWLKDGSDFIYIGKSLPNGELQDIVRYRVENNHLAAITQAASARFASDSWELSNVLITQYGAHGVTQKHLSHESGQNLVSPSMLKVIVNTDYLTLKALWSYIHYQQANGLDASSFELSFWQIVLQPVAIVILMLMALPFVFGPLRSSTMGLRLIVGLICGFAFFIVGQFFAPISALYHITPFIGAMLPNLIFAVFLYVLIRKMH